MAKNFGAIAYSDAVKAMQEKLGSRAAYARMERDTLIDGLSENEIQFIQERDSFYMASIGANGFPYVQHRGGPKGFLKVLDKKRIGFLDFSGNRQYITTGNLSENANVAIIMVDYPARARLKIFAKAAVVALKDDPGLYHALDLTNYTFKPERMMVFSIEAYDWNCPQHIVPRYTAEEIREALLPQQERMTALEEEVQRLRATIREAGI
jgi:predicted pyridoxine 5'-phosphate oxidase superfamily flavin-nucleotide-binding protein